MKVTENLTNSRVRRVSSLINQEYHSWNEELVRNIFMPFDAEEILKIRLPNYEQEDFISWAPECHGMFTVRSAYNLALDLRDAAPPSTSSNTTSDRPIWRNIWNSKAPPKVKIFTWKLATNSLAVQVNRSRRLPNVLPICTICGMEEETGFHATMRCTRAVELRQALANSWKLPTEPELINTGDDWVLVSLDKLSADMRVKMMFIWWRAWHHRNDIIFGKGDASVENSARFLQNYLCTLQGITKGEVTLDRKGKSPIVPDAKFKQVIADKEVEEEIWKKPEDGWIKCNVDASFLNDERKGTWGAVIRNQNGLTVCSAWGIIPNCQTAAMGEAVACLKGLNLAVENSDQNIIIETDCLSILKAFMEDNNDRSEVCMIAKEFKIKKPPDRRVILTKVSRKCNQVAHELCQLARRGLCSGMMQGSLPTCVLRSALLDCNPNTIV
jgi:ribonuclease HI